MRNIFWALMLGFSVPSFGGPCSCVGWDLMGTYFQPDKLALSYWVPKELFDRVVVAVGPVVVEDNRRNLFSSVATLDKAVPATSGRARAVVSGKSYCCDAGITGKGGVLALDKEVKLYWVDKDKTFDLQMLKSQMLVLSLRKR